MTYVVMYADDEGVDLDTLFDVQRAKSFDGAEEAEEYAKRLNTRTNESLKVYKLVETALYRKSGR